MVVSPGLEPGTFSVLARNHDQLDHETNSGGLIVEEWCLNLAYDPRDPVAYRVDLGLAGNPDLLMVCA